MENGQFTLSFYVFYFLVYKMENVYPYIFQNGKWPIQLKVSVLFLITLSPFSPFLKWKMANSLSFLISLIFLFSLSKIENGQFTFYPYIYLALPLLYSTCAKWEMAISAKDVCTLPYNTLSLLSFSKMENGKFIVVQNGKWPFQLKMSVPLYNNFSLLSFSKMDNGKFTVYPYIPYISERFLFSSFLVANSKRDGQSAFLKTWYNLVMHPSS